MQTVLKPLTGGANVNLLKSLIWNSVYDIRGLQKGNSVFDFSENRLYSYNGILGQFNINVYLFKTINNKYNIFWKSCDTLISNLLSLFMVCETNTEWSTPTKKQLYQ